MSFFINYPEFVDMDSRKDRGFSQVTIESLDKRHAAMTPGWLVDGNTVLDLGSCLGATGHWCLSNGATHYTGVEVQPELVNTSRTLLSKHWDQTKFTILQQDVREFLDSKIANGQTYDVVILIGVIYAFLDTYGILDKLSKISKYVIVIDSIYPWPMMSPDVAMIDVIRKQHINSSDSNTAFAGAGARPSPSALKIMFESLGFKDKEGVIYPEQLSDKTVHDSYSTLVERMGPSTYKLPSRYLMRYFKSDGPGIRQVGDLVKNNVAGSKEKMKESPKVLVADNWTFDSTVAGRFQQEAETHIPDYARVIDMCMDYTNQVYKTTKDIKVIDVGSALGNTMDKYIKAGYANVYGVDNSDAMNAKSLHPDRVTISNELPEGPWNCILANWTLHFIAERRAYLQRMYDQLESGGFVIVSDKMDHSMETETLYYDFKRANGVSEEVIQQKKKALIGVLTTKPLQWYIDTMDEIGFLDIQVINSKYMFSTIYARKF